MLLPQFQQSDVSLALTSVRQRGRHYPRRCLLRTNQQALPHVITTGCSMLQAMSGRPSCDALGASWSRRSWQT